MSVTERTRPTAKPLRQAQMLVDGRWISSASGDTLAVENPAERRRIADIARGGAADVDRAVEAVSLAFPAWSNVPPRH